MNRVVRSTSVPIADLLSPIRGHMTPAAVHQGHAAELHAQRAEVLAEAYARTPERFVRRPPALPTAVWINKPAIEEVASEIPTPTVSPELTGSDHVVLELLAA